MQQFTSLPKEYKERILCGYFNSTSHIQIARIANISNWYFERVVFPGERVLFEAVPEAELEIHSCQLPSAILMDKQHCNSLQVRERTAGKNGE